MARIRLPHGCWPSPITARVAAGKSLRFCGLMADDESLYWCESRPAEGGRGAIMCASPDGSVKEVLPPPYSARSRVHEYGGGEFTARDGALWFVEAETQDIHTIKPDGVPRPLTTAPDTGFADLTCDLRHQRLIAVAERHAPGGVPDHPENFLAAIPLEGPPVRNVTPLLGGRDFYASPRVSPSGDALAWLAWDLPHMPWEAAELHVAPVGMDGGIEPGRRLAGGDGAAVFQPEWTSDGRLLFVWDRTGWGNLYVWNGTDIAPVTCLEAELMRPQWVFGMRSYAPLADGRIAAVFLENGEPSLRVIDPATGAAAPRRTPFRGIDSIAPFGGNAAVIGATDHAAPAVLWLPPNNGEAEMLRPGLEVAPDPDDVSAAHLLELENGGETIYALYYPPANAVCAAPAGVLPPVILTAHGGPTAQADRGFKIKTQFWTSRGFGVCDVDYSGSAGYGRAYRRRLDGQWGIRDVADIAAAARRLVEDGLAEQGRLLISGSSAGGYTALMALSTLDLFAAGACSYPVCDLAQLQRITHKFEAGYLYTLTGATAETCGPVFAERSPINLAARISAPVIFFQGAEDKVVPPEQSQAMADTLRAKGVRVAYHLFPGEAHGFRQADTITAVLDLECAFYRDILSLPLPAEEGSGQDPGA